MNDALLQAKGLSKRYGGLLAVNDVSLSLYKDQLHAVIGPNGAGKTTLTHLLSGDVAPTQGELGWVDTTSAAGRTTVCHCMAWVAVTKRPMCF